MSRKEAIPIRRIMITGGSGFIGTPLARSLVRENYEVVVFDLLPPVSPVAGVKYVIGDVRNLKQISEHLVGVDATYHFAAQVSVPYCQENPVISLEHNVLGTCNLLEAVRVLNQSRPENPIRVIFSSSASVYGDLGNDSEPISEDIPLDTPKSFYGMHKIAADQLLKNYFSAFAVPSLIFRFFNVYGEGQDPNSPYSGVISIFSERAKKKLPLTIYGDGSQTRDFISVHDIISACQKTLLLPISAYDAKIMNLGSGKKISILKLAESISKLYQDNQSFSFSPLRSEDVRYSLANINRSKKLLDWIPQSDLLDHLKSLIR